MRDLPTTRDFEDFYNASKAASELRRYRSSGPIPSTRMLIVAVKTEGVEGATVIDIGGGINVYPDWKRLIQVSAARARRLYGLVYPRNTLPVRIVVSLMNLFVWRGPVHASVRPPDVIERVVSEAGFVRCFSSTTGPWHVAVYRRH